MSKKNSIKKYEELKTYYKTQARNTEKQLHMDLVAVRHEYVPHHLKSKFLTGCAIFGSVYLVEKMIFGKRLPRIIRFTTALSSIVWAPKVYQKLHDKLTGVGELEPIEMEMIEDQQLAEDEGIAYPEEEPVATDEDEPAQLSTPPETDTLEKPEEDYNKPHGGLNPT
jgi:hypothetical protein